MLDRDTVVDRLLAATGLPDPAGGMARYPGQEPGRWSPIPPLFAEDAHEPSQYPRLLAMHLVEHATGTLVDPRRSLQAALQWPVEALLRELFAMTSEYPPGEDIDEVLALLLVDGRLRSDIAASLGQRARLRLERAQRTHWASTLLALLDENGLLQVDDSPDIVTAIFDRYEDLVTRAAERLVTVLVAALPELAPAGEDPATRGHAEAL